MKRTLALLVALWLVAPAFAQPQPKSSKSAPKASTDDGARVVQLDEEMANVVDSDKGNCDKMATDLKAFTDKNGAEMRRLSQEGQKRTKDQQAEFMNRYGTRVRAAAAKMNAAIPACLGNPRVKAALAGLSSGAAAPAAPPKR